MRLSAQRWLTGLAALALTTSLGCGRDRDEAATNATPAATPAVDTALNAPDNPDWWTTTKVQAKFFTDEVVKGRNVDVTTQNGVVSLTGTVDSEAAKTRAVEVARGVDGVTSVEDHLQVEKPGKPAAPAQAETVATSGRVEGVALPAWITTKIQAQYFADPDIKPWNIDVTTMSNGAVTLSGTVDDENDRTKAAAIARNTEGVTAVENRLRVRGEKEGAAAAPTTALPDGWITAKIQSKYFLDDDVKGRNINVDTKDGVVTLNGTVDTEAQRTQAAALARATDGVKEVREQLRVQPAAAAKSRTDIRMARPNTIDNDAWLTTKIRSRFFVDPRVKNMNVDVSTQGGVVTLKGQVEDQAARAAAEEIAKQIDGVKQVTNELTIKTPQDKQ